jgi:hypothetical protein
MDRKQLQKNIDRFKREDKFTMDTKIRQQNSV